MAAACALAGTGRVVHGTVGAAEIQEIAAEGLVALGLSSDGQVVVGGRETPNGQEAMRWMQATGVIGLGDLPGGNYYSLATSCSADGAVVCGASNSGLGTEAFRWTSSTGILGLADLPEEPFGSVVYGVSGDGSIMVGYGIVGTPRGSWRTRACMWPVGMRPINLGVFGDQIGNNSIAWGVSGDGATIVGGSDYSDVGLSEAFRWHGGSMTGLGFLPGTTWSEAQAISGDGVVIFGGTIAENGNDFAAFRWTQSEGMVSIGEVEGASGVSLRFAGANHDGRIAVGTAYAAAGIAIIWDQAHGIRQLKDVLVTDYGLAGAVGWNLTGAVGVSADGMTIVGNGTNPSGQARIWIVHLAPDADGDGLLDDWETDGIPYTDSLGATRLYILDADGDGITECDPLHKDLFVEIDAMSGLAPAGAALGRVVNAFAAAPVGNPDGTSGIALHVNADEGTIPAAAWTLDDTDGNGTLDWPTEFDAIKLTATSGTTLAGFFGTVSERNDPDAATVRGAKAKAYRYCVFAQQFDAGGTSGLAELPGNDCMVTLGLWPAPGGGGGGTTNQQAGTFMHELGHTLGLGHGGRAPDGTPDHTNFKPNYYSVMSYNWQNPRGWQSPGSWPLDAGRFGYSAFALPTIDEAAADDCLPGLVGPVSALAGVRYPHNTHNDGGIPPVVVYGRYDVAADWNTDDVDQCGPSALPVDLTRVRAGHRRSPGETLNGRDDWAVLVYKFIDLPEFNPGVHGDALGDGAAELDIAEDAAIEAMLAPYCSGDVVDDRSVNIDDLLMVINSWGPCSTGCLADITPLPADGLVNIDDLLAVINAWGPCP